MFMVKARSMLLQKGTLLCRSSIPALSRGFRFSRQSLFSPDLYEGSRTDRRPYPSPVSGLEKDTIHDEPDDEHLEAGAYALQADPSTPSAHPDAHDIEVAHQIEDAHKLDKGRQHIGNSKAQQAENAGSDHNKVPSQEAKEAEMRAPSLTEMLQQKRP